MKILIVAATAPEIAESISFLEEKGIDYLITGVGMVATAFALGQRLAQQPYDLLLNVGIAGTFDQQESLGRLFRIEEDQLFQLGAENEQAFIPIEELGFGESRFFAHYKGLPLPATYLNLPATSAITVNKVHGCAAHIAQVSSQLASGSLESMEGAAFFYAAKQAQTPAIQVRAISNYIESRNTAHWNIPKALLNLNQWLQEFCRQQAS